MKIQKLFLIGLLFLGLVGCGGTTSIKTGILITPKITIEAIDRSFTIKSDKVFKTPFQSKSCIRGVNVDYNDLIKEGAKKVKIHFDNGDPSLYGIIQFCKRIDKYKRETIISSDQHVIEIPSEYIRSARKGINSRIYQRIGIGDEGSQSYGWVLLISNRPY